MHNKNNSFSFAKYLIYAAIIFMTINCSFLKRNKSVKASHNCKTLFYSTYSSTDSSGVAYFVCDDFVNDALNRYTIKSITREHLNILKCSKESFVNRHDRLVIDTIYTFYNGENKIQFYRAKQNDFIFTFDVTDPVFKMAGNIKPGITKECFAMNFNINQSLNTNVQMVNSEGTMRFMFYFENDMLKRINSYLYLD